jgi:hypothetical protein
MSGSSACSQWSRGAWQRARRRTVVAGIDDEDGLDPSWSTAAISRCASLRLERVGAEGVEDVGVLPDTGARPQAAGGHGASDDRRRSRLWWGL